MDILAIRELYREVNRIQKEMRDRNQGVDRLEVLARQLASVKFQISQLLGEVVERPASPFIANL